MKDHVQQRILENQILILEMLPNAISEKYTRGAFEVKSEEAVMHTKAVIIATA